MAPISPPRLGTVLLVAMVVLSGCNAPFGGGESTPSPSAPASEALPSGLTESSVAVETVLEGHRDALENRGYRLLLNRTDIANTTRHVQVVGSGWEQYRSTYSRRFMTVRSYTTADASYEILGSGGVTEYRAYSNRTEPATGVEYLQEHVPRWGAFELATQRERNGTTVFVFRATEPRESATEVADLNQTLVVDDAGIIRELRSTITWESEARLGPVETTFRITKVGDATVEPTDWMAGAPSPAPDGPIYKVTKPIPQLGVTVTLVGQRPSVYDFRIYPAQNAILRQSETIERVSASRYVVFELPEGGSLRRLDVTMAYDPSAAPGDEAGLELHEYQYQTLLPVDGTVHTENDTASVSFQRMNRSRTLIVIHRPTWVAVWDGSPPERPIRPADS